MRHPNRPILGWVILTIISWALIVCGFPGTAGAQSHEDVQADLERTDRVLDRAADLLGEAGTPLTREAIGEARRLQREARAAFDNGNLERAATTTREARNRVLDLLTAQPRLGEASDEVERQLRRTDRLLAQLRDEIPSRGHGPWVRQLGAAEGMQERAWRFYWSNRLRPALRLTLEARETASLLRDRGGRSRGPRWDRDRYGARLERNLEHLGVALEQLAARVSSDNTRAQQELNMARSAHEAARRALDEDHLMVAERYVRQTRTALLRAAEALDRGLRTDVVGSLVEEAQRRWEELREPVRDGGSDRVEKWHERAGEDIAKAKHALAGGDLRHALVQVRAAVALMDEVNEELGL